MYGVHGQKARKWDGRQNAVDVQSGPIVYDSVMERIVFRGDDLDYAKFQHVSSKEASPAC